MILATGTTFLFKHHNRKMAGECKQLKLYSQDSPGRELMAELEGTLENVKIQMVKKFSKLWKARARYLSPDFRFGYQRSPEDYQKVTIR